MVENGSPGSAARALAALLADDPGAPVVVVRPGKNLGYGAGVNRGLAALSGLSPPPPWVLVANPDLHVHPGAVDALRSGPRGTPGVGSGRPADLTPTTERSIHRCAAFPSFLDAAGHALLALFNPENPFTKRYNPGVPEGAEAVEAEWISGSCFLARRGAFEELGGFDEAYFMYAEDMDLCWRAHQAGWGIGFTGAAERHAHTGREHGQASLQDDGRAPPFGLAVHRPDHVGLAPGRCCPWPWSSSACAWGSPRHASL